MTPTERDLLHSIAAQSEKLARWLVELVAIPTVNPYSGDSSAASEKVGQEWIADRFRELGAGVRLVPVPPDVYERGGMIGPEGRSWEGRENVVAEWTLGEGSGPTVLLNTHMDTVGADGMEIAPFDPAVRDGKLYGRGASDSKGNLVVGLIAAEALRGAPGLNGRLVFESVVDEECNGGGAGTLACCLAGVNADYAVCLDGQAGGVYVGCNGVGTARLLVRGQAGHSSQGDSVSAIDKAIAVKGAIDDFARARSRRFPHCATTVGVFRSGTLPAIVPGEAELQLNMSYDVSEAEEAARRLGRWGGGAFFAEFERAMAGMAERDEWFKAKPIEVSWIKDLPAYLCDAGDPFIRRACECASDVAGKPVGTTRLQAWSDASHLALQLGAPVAGIGSGEPGTAHAAVEYAVLDDLVRGAQTVALTVMRTLGRKDER